MPNTGKKRPRNAILVATAIEIHCPHCDASIVALGGSEFCEPREAREICDGSTKECPSCEGPVRMIWHDKISVAGASE